MIAVRMRNMMIKVFETTMVVPDGDSHVFVMHSSRWHLLARERPQWLKLEPPGWELIGHEVVGVFHDVPIICGENAEEGRVYLLGLDELKANVRRGLQL